MIVDDDAGLREAVGDFLLANGYDVDTAADGRQMDRGLARRPADLVLLDLMLPGEDGLSLCRRLARPGGPAIIMFSAAGDEVDRIVGLEVGADHYLAKPCAPRELLAWVRAVLRRRCGRIEDRQAPSAYAFAGWRLDPIQAVLTAPDGAAVDIPGRSFALLRAFLDRPGRLVSRARIAAMDSGRLASDQAVDGKINGLRRVLGRVSEGTEFIRTVRGEGYVFMATVTRSP